MEIQIGNTVLTVNDDLDALGYYRLIKRISRMLLGVSGCYIEPHEQDALALNLHRFLIDNPAFLVGVVNAGKTKSEEK